MQCTFRTIIGTAALILFVVGLAWACDALDKLAAVACGTPLYFLLVWLKRRDARAAGRTRTQSGPPTSSAARSDKF
jgi:hypothetical protein